MRVPTSLPTKVACLLGIALLAGVSLTRAQEASPSGEPAPASDLALRQGRIADRYARLEQLMLKMAEIDGGTNPQRAALLKQAVQQSKEKLTRAQLEGVVKLLDQQKLKRAVDGQTAATTEMKALLELLLSENRANRNKGEQDRIKQYIEEVERLLRLQKDVQGRTEGGDQEDRLAPDQAKLADRTGDLAKKIQENEEAGEKKEPADNNGEKSPPSEDGEPADPKPDDTKPDDMKPGESPAGEKPADPMSGEPMPGGETKPMSGEPMPGQSGESKPKPSQPMAEQPQNPARQRLQKAEQKMREAQKKLEEAKRDDAKTDQEQARQELEKAKAELEEILRQLREEEIERTLAQLEARFRKMLEMELKVQEATQRLAAIPTEARTRDIDIQCSKLAVEQRKIGLEADKARQLLLEEGSSIAFPESVDEICTDMEAVAERLASARLDEVTLGTEEDIIAALQELIAALQQAQKDQEEKNKDEQPPPPPSEGQEEDQPLVDRIAELKMLKSLQLRVNERTKRYSRLLGEPDDLTGQATDGDLADAIEKLAERQSRLQRITRDIVLGKNQ